MKKNNKFEITTITPMDVLGTSLMNQVLGKKRWGGVNFCHYPVAFLIATNSLR